MRLGAQAQRPQHHPLQLALLNAWRRGNRQGVTEDPNKPARSGLKKPQLHSTSAKNHAATINPKMRLESAITQIHNPPSIVTCGSSIGDELMCIRLSAGPVSEQRSQPQVLLWASSLGCCRCTVNSNWSEMAMGGSPSFGFRTSKSYVATHARTFTQRFKLCLLQSRNVKWTLKKNHSILKLLAYTNCLLTARSALFVSHLLLVRQSGPRVRECLQAHPPPQPPLCLVCCKAGECRALPHRARRATVIIQPPGQLREWLEAFVVQCDSP